MTKLTILLVEDEDLLRDGVQEILELHGFQVIGAADGKEALQWLEEVQVGLIITDLVMPLMNGVDFVEQVKIKYPALPIVVASGSPGSVMTRLGIDSVQLPGAAGSIIKPFTSAELISLINKVLT